MQKDTDEPDDLQRDLQRPADSPAPTGHRSTSPADKDPATGRFLPGNTASLVHGGRRSLGRPEALAAIAGKRADLAKHLGDDPSVIQADLITDYARVDVLIESVAQNIEIAGILTPKGRTRAATTLLLSLMDRRLRLAVTLGLERRSTPVDLARTLSGMDR
jgi:hypothetical protein